MSNVTIEVGESALAGIGQQAANGATYAPPTVTTLGTTTEVLADYNRLYYDGPYVTTTRN